ncbi:nicotinate-nucleotide--dimethylbenzimidazole phosphoribosyltransferase [Sphingomonas cavernae]|uniref:Nicotinate-nucleotide--dimethylbenzimidazole phosphoribosyltransferase n=1 Tax=Sphingomonas cavernae TaxID=2320861 RepID=A0A418WL03_9SPHN|nr:nicotinate-nucleotide--dimethylbenzimidazole phosphoribosyltransferase [Sphingomonas cavernae]RJF90717.1 nicotinate-nucleotide--dimethylbenzimidazole phosphoribosyltransferase [Sphingomonas cavernae]
MTFFPTIQSFDDALASLPSADMRATAAATWRQAQLTKPEGSLGRLEEIAIFFAGWQARERPAIERGRVAIFAGNHGITDHGVSAFPPEVTIEMVRNFERGGAAINALSTAAGLELTVVPLALDRPTADFTTGPAMSETECLEALSAGAAAVEDGLDLLVVGEMGIGNTTPAAALTARSFGGTGRYWVGTGTGIDFEGLARKVRVVDAGLARHAGAPNTAFETLRRLGGREIAAIAGAVLAARLKRVPVILDGFITCAAVAPLAAANAAITEHCLAGHCSMEQGHHALLDRLRLEPLLRLSMRLGEGSGAAVAAQIVRSALAAHAGMATFAEAGVSGGQ